MFAQLTWFLGIVSIVQMVFLPGFIICRSLKLEDCLAPRWALYFFVSLSANYFLVFILTGLHLYDSAVLRILVSVETVLALLIARQNLFRKPGWRCAFPRLTAYWQMGPIQKWTLSLSLITLVSYGIAFLMAQGQAFGYWDPTVSYNPWAVEWARNHFPEQTWDYPQLLPTNWSLTYVLIGQLNWGMPLEFFPRAIMGLFPFFMLAIFWEKMLNERDASYGFGLIVTGLLIADLLSAYIGHGYADIPVAAMAFASAMILLKREPSLPSVLLGTVLCAAAALTKQAGLWLVLIYPLLSYLTLKPKMPLRKRAVIISLQIPVLLLLVLSWYGLVWWGPLHQNLEWSYLSHGIYQQASFAGRLQLIWQKSGLFFWVCLAVALLYSYKKSPRRLPFILIALPIVIIWMLFFSYDNRNLSLSLPFIGLLAGEALYQFLSLPLTRAFLFFVKKLILNVSYGEWLAVVLLSLVLVGWQPGFKAGDLNAYQVRAKQKIGYPDLNRMLEDYQAKVGFHGKILTAWSFLFNDLPLLSNLVQPLSPQFYGANMLPDVSQNQAAFLQTLKAYPAVRYLLIDKEQQLSSPEFYQYLAKMQQSGKLKEIGETPHFVLYEITVPLNNIR